MSILSSLVYDITTKNSELSYYKVKVYVNKNKAVITDLNTHKDKTIKHTSKYNINYIKCWLGNPNSNIDVNSKAFKFNMMDLYNMEMDHPSDVSYTCALFQLTETEYLFVHDKILMFESSEPILILSAPMNDYREVMPYVETSNYTIVLTKIPNLYEKFVIVNNNYKDSFKYPIDVIKQFGYDNVLTLKDEIFVYYTEL